MIKKSKSRKRIAIRRRGIASPETKMMRYEFLSGDVNWRTYGGKWYRRIDPHMYYVIEFINFLDATNELYDGKYKYVVTGEFVDLTPGSPWHKQIPNALAVVGETPGSVASELQLLEAVHIYMGGDKEFELFGNNADQLLAEAKRRL
jgi:hypothetical protein